MLRLNRLLRQGFTKRVRDNRLPFSGYSRAKSDSSTSFSALQDGSIRDDKSGNVYNASGLLIFNNMLEDGDDNLPDFFKKEIDDLSQDHSKFTSNKKRKSYRLKLNNLRGAIKKFSENTGGGHERPDDVAQRMYTIVERLEKFTLYPNAPLLPDTLGARAVMAQGYAAEHLYRDVKPVIPKVLDLIQVDQIDSSKSPDSIENKKIDVNQSKMTPEGDGLKWWACAAISLRNATKDANGITLLHLRVGSGNVPIGLKPPEEKHPAGEFIVFGHDAPVVLDINPNQNGLRIPKSAKLRHRVSYPAFIGHLKNVRSTKDNYPVMEDPEIATALLAMVKKPKEDSPGVLPADLGVLREFLTTWMVAETARHRSVIFNSVLMLKQIENGDFTFEAAIKDGGFHPMSGKGTAEAGRTVETEEKRLLEGEYTNVGDPYKTRNVARKQAEQLSRLSPSNMSMPLQELLKEFTGEDVSLRQLPVPKK